MALTKVTGKMATFDNGASGSVKRDLYDKLAETVSVKDFGAKGDGVTDDTAAIQAAIDFCKANPGYNLRFPRGSYLVTTSLDCTYAGSAAGLGSGYYGFTVEGEDQLNTFISGATSGTPVWDLTGKPRMTFRNIGFSNYTDGAHNPSCHILLARNLTNGYAGGHVFDRVNFRGYVTQTGVQCASSEVNKFINVDFEIYKAGASGIELTEQIETTVNSEYIDLSSHTFSGGNTRHMFLGCAFNGSAVPSGTHYVRCSGIDNSTFVSCYSHFGSGEAEFLFSGGCSNVTFIDHRGEGSADYHLRLASGVSVNGLRWTGRSSAPFRGEDTSTFSNSVIDGTSIFLGSGTATYSFDAYDATDCEIKGGTNGYRVRNSARGTTFLDYKGAGSLSLPTGDLTQPESFGTSYSGGASNYRRRSYTKSKWERRDVGRLEVNTLVLNTTYEGDLNATNYPSGYTPDMNVASQYSFVVTGSVTINAPSNADLGPGDAKGQILIMTISQNAVGGHTVTLPSNYDLQGATIPTSAYSRISLMFTYASTSGGGKWMRIN